MQHRCCYPGCDKNVERRISYCPHHCSLIRGNHGRLKFTRQCGTPGCSGVPYGRKAIFCVECVERINRETNQGNYHAKANGKRHCKCGCGRVISEYNRSGLAKPCYDRLGQAKRREEKKMTDVWAHLWKDGLLEPGLIGVKHEGWTP